MYEPSGGKLSQFELGGPRVIEKKGRYRDEDEKK